MIADRRWQGAPPVRQLLWLRRTGPSSKSLSASTASAAEELAVRPSRDAGLADAADRLERPRPPVSLLSRCSTSLSGSTRAVVGRPPRGAFLRSDEGAALPPSCADLLLHLLQCQCTGYVRPLELEPYQLFRQEAFIIKRDFTAGDMLF